MSRRIMMRVAQLDNGKWVVEFGDRWKPEAPDWGSFEDSTQHATRKGAEDEMRQNEIDSANDAAAEQRYQSQIAYACGERD